MDNDMFNLGYRDVCFIYITSYMESQLKRPIEE
jgi:hypothetical protein